MFVCGTTFSADFPTTTNAYSSSISGESDAFIAKFDKDLSSETVNILETGTEFADAIILKASPNPMSTYSMIEFYIPQDCFGELFVTDLMGRIIKSIIDAPLKKDSYTYNLKIADIQGDSQMLLIHLQTSYKGKTFIKTLKLIVAK